MEVTMEVIVSVIFGMFLLMDAAESCLDLFQSMLTKIMITLPVLCSSGAVPVPVEDAGNMALREEAAEADHGATGVMALRPCSVAAEAIAVARFA